MDSPENTTPDTIAETLFRWDEVLGAISRMTVRTRRVVRMCITIIIIDVLLTGAVGYAINGYYDSIRTNSHASCLAGNQFRAGDKALWEYVLHIAAKADTTPHGKAIQHDFQKKLNMIEAPRKC